MSGVEQVEERAEKKSEREQLTNKSGKNNKKK
jgi:hypothetical protein